MSVTPNRRVFMMQVAAAGTALAAGHAHAKTKITESDPQAAAVGYKLDATKVDTRRFPKYKAGERCNNCMAWASKPTEEWGECTLFDNKFVVNTGWCSSYLKG